MFSMQGVILPFVIGFITYHYRNPCSFSKNSHCFRMVGDGHEPNNGGLEGPIFQGFPSFSRWDEMSEHPQYKELSLDPGTCTN